jgi:hypothetical protein
MRGGERNTEGRRLGPWGSEKGTLRGEERDKERQRKGHWGAEKNTLRHCGWREVNNKEGYTIMSKWPVPKESLSQKKYHVQFIKFLLSPKISFLWWNTVVCCRREENKFIYSTTVHSFNISDICNQYLTNCKFAKEIAVTAIFKW